MELTIESMTERITKSEDVVAEYINAHANKAYFAKYSTGAYGRIFIPLIRLFYAGVNLNGQSTHLAIAITRAMEAKGYEYAVADGKVTFTKTRKAV